MERKLFSWHPQGQQTEVSEASCHQGPYAYPSPVSPLQPPPRPSSRTGPLLGPSPSVQLGHTFKEGYLLCSSCLCLTPTQRETGGSARGSRCSPPPGRWETWVQFYQKGHECQSYRPGSNSSVSCKFTSALNLQTRPGLERGPLQM